MLNALQQIDDVTYGAPYSFVCEREKTPSHLMFRSLHIVYSIPREPTRWVWSTFCYFCYRSTYTTEIRKKGGIKTITHGHASTQSIRTKQRTREWANIIRITIILYLKLKWKANTRTQAHINSSNNNNNNNVDVNNNMHKLWNVQQMQCVLVHHHHHPSIHSCITLNDDDTFSIISPGSWHQYSTIHAHCGLFHALLCCTHILNKTSVSKWNKWWHKDDGHRR